MGIASGFLALLSVFVLASPVSTAPPLLSRASEHDDGQWQKCSVFNVNSSDPNLACGYFEVPMDYHDANAGKARLAVAKYAGTASKKLGTLFLNPGGPGSSGVDLVTGGGQKISELFKGAYDVVSWDPRGVGLFTFPGDVTCFNSEDEADAFFNNNTIYRSINYTIAVNFDQQDEDELFSRADEDEHLFREFGKRCQKGPVGKYLQYIGTSSTVRDLVSLGDCIVGKDKPIDFWGFSYGTVIGMNFLNMFPERAGHVILDGVVDPESWASFRAVGPSLIDAEKTYSAFADACAASGRARCRLIDFIGGYPKGSDIRKLVDDGQDTLTKLWRLGAKVPIPPGDMRTYLHQVLATPSTWSKFANFDAYDLLISTFQTARSLQLPLCGNYTIALAPRGGSITSPRSPTRYSFGGISGADNSRDTDDRVTIRDVLREIVRVTRTTSKTFGAIWSLGYNFGWPVHSVERLPPFNFFEKLKSRVLIIGNTADPITPFAGAQKAAALLGNHATLVEHVGVGHTSVAELSTCTLTTIAEYLLYSKLPDVPSGQHIKCEVDPIDLFPQFDNSSIPEPGWNLAIGRRR